MLQRRLEVIREPRALQLQLLLDREASFREGVLAVGRMRIPQQRDDTQSYQ